MQSKNVKHQPEEPTSFRAFLDNINKNNNSSTATVESTATATATEIETRNTETKQSETVDIVERPKDYPNWLYVGASVEVCATNRDKWYNGIILDVYPFKAKFLSMPNTKTTNAKDAKKWKKNGKRYNRCSVKIFKEPDVITFGNFNWKSFNKTIRPSNIEFPKWMKYNTNVLAYLPRSKQWILGQIRRYNDGQFLKVEYSPVDKHRALTDAQMRENRKQRKEQTGAMKKRKNKNKNKNGETHTDEKETKIVTIKGHQVLCGLTSFLNSRDRAIFGFDTLPVSIAYLIISYLPRNTSINFLCLHPGLQFCKARFRWRQVYGTDKCFGFYLRPFKGLPFTGLEIRMPFPELTKLQAYMLKLKKCSNHLWGYRTTSLTLRSAGMKRKRTDTQVIQCDFGFGKENWESECTMSMQHTYVIAFRYTGRDFTVPPGLLRSCVSPDGTRRYSVDGMIKWMQCCIWNSDNAMMNGQKSAQPCIWIPNIRMCLFEKYVQHDGMCAL